MLLLPGLIHATIFGSHTTNAGKVVDLGNLEWLELTHTENLSRTDIESGAGGFIAGGWRYATRTETEGLLDSLWREISEESIADNFDGARWFFDQFELGENFPSMPYPGYSTGGATSWNLTFGADYECHTWAGYACLGHVSMQGLNFASIPLTARLDIVLANSVTTGACQPGSHPTTPIW